MNRNSLENTLMKMPKKDLAQLCNYYSQSSNGTKQNLVWNLVGGSNNPFITPRIQFYNYYLSQKRNKGLNVKDSKLVHEESIMIYRMFTSGHLEINAYRFIDYLLELRRGEREKFFRGWALGGWEGPKYLIDYVLETAIHNMKPTKKLGVKLSDDYGKARLTDKDIYDLIKQIESKAHDLRKTTDKKFIRPPDLPEGALQIMHRSNIIRRKVWTDLTCLISSGSQNVTPGRNLFLITKTNDMTNHNQVDLLYVVDIGVTHGGNVLTLDEGDKSWQIRAENNESALKWKNYIVTGIENAAKVVGLTLNPHNKSPIDLVNFLRSGAEYFS